jgi:predicted MFS family arabinose efflux permease
MSYRSKAGFALAVLFAINTMNFFDRQILGAVGETVKNQLELSDTALGTLGTAFIVLYAIIGVPLGRLTDKIMRTRILAVGVTVWSLFTVLSGMAVTYTQLFLARLGVGVGEASCAPAASSLIGDLFPAAKRAKALAIFMLGLPIGVALSFAVSSWFAQQYGWRSAFYLAGIPGVICAVLALLIREPKRGGAETHNISTQKREGSPYWLVLSIPTMWWIILSGALHNFNMYAIGSFLSPFLQRVHRISEFEAGLVSMVAFGLAGIPGLMIGGALGDSIMRKRPNGRMVVSAIAIAISVPFTYFALQTPVGSVATYTILMSIACAAMYVYYSTVYSTIQDVIEPSLRGTAMALYFFAMYVLGAALGPLGMGALSDYFFRQAAAGLPIAEMTRPQLAPYIAEGLHSALYIIPILGVLLAIVLFAGSMTVAKDMERLQRWMRESAEKNQPAGAKAGAAD